MCQKNLSFSSKKNHTYLTTLLKRGAWWKPSSANGSASSAARGQDVLASGVNWRHGQLAHVQISGVHGVGGKAVVTVGDDRVEEVLEHGEGLLVTGDGANGLDVGVTLKFAFKFGKFLGEHKSRKGRGYYTIQFNA